MQDSLNEVSVLSAMITPAVLISVFATLIFSTLNRLARIVDRVRNLMASIERLSSTEDVDFSEDRTREIANELALEFPLVLVDNPSGSTPAALNIAMLATNADGIDAVRPRASEQ
jgi:hypothetical protein